MIAEEQYKDKAKAGSYNVGPNDADCITTGQLVDLFCKYWGGGLHWIDRSDNGPHEANFLKLDCSRLKMTFGWKPVWCVDDAVEKSVEWTKTYLENQMKVPECLEEQIKEFQMQIRIGR